MQRRPESQARSTDVMARQGESSNVDREAGGIIEFGIPGLLSVSKLLAGQLLALGCIILFI